MFLQLITFPLFCLKTVVINMPQSFCLSCWDSQRYESPPVFIFYFFLAINIKSGSLIKYIQVTQGSRQPCRCVSYWAVFFDTNIFLEKQARKYSTCMICSTVVEIKDLLLCPYLNEMRKIVSKWKPRNFPCKIKGKFALPSECCLLLKISTFLFNI